MTGPPVVPELEAVPVAMPVLLPAEVPLDPWPPLDEPPVVAPELEDVEVDEVGVPLLPATALVPAFVEPGAAVLQLQPASMHPKTSPPSSHDFIEPSSGKKARRY